MKTYLHTFDKKVVFWPLLDNRTVINKKYKYRKGKIKPSLFTNGRIMSNEILSRG